MDHRDKAQRRSRRGHASRWVALGLAAILLLAAVSAQAASPARRAPLNPEFVAYQEALAAMALPRTVTEDGHALGLIPNPVDLSHMTGLLPQAFGDRTPRGFPATYDLRTLGRVTAIRDQGSCGSCWSFAGLASLESWLLTGPLETWDFSENNLKECHGFDWGACDGGNSSMVTAYLARRSGPVRESDDPYRDYPVGCTAGLTIQKIVRDVLFIPDRSGSLDNDTLKQAITTYGAISTDLYWVSGSYKAATHAYYYSGAAGANHAVDLVGWNDAYSRTNFQSTPAGDGAWIVRNSWGSEWGDAGYFYVSYYDARIGQGNVAAVNAVAPDGTTVYQYDPLGWITNWGYGSTTAWGANVFTASSAGEIRSVATYASTVNTTYQILVKSALNGTTLATKTGSWPLAGFHTVDLSAPVPVAAGQTFVIAVRYTTPAYNFPIPAECEEAGYSSGASASAGQSYISSDGSSWTDITTAWLWGDPTCNVCIKAIVGPASAPPSNEPVGYWRFNEGSGSTTADSSGNGNTGTISGASWTSSSPDSTTVLAFDGIDDYVQVANASSLNPTNALTIEAWIKPNAIPSGQQKAIVEKAYTSPVAPYYQYFLGTYVSEVILYVCVNGQSKYQVSSGAGLAAGKWSHIAAVFDGQNIRLYVDGVIKGSGNVGAGTIPSYNTPLFFGKHKDFTTERFNGAIDEVRIHNRALDPTEFNLLPAGPAPTAPALVTNFTASDGANAQSTLAWTNPSDSDLAQVVVLRKTGSYPTSHTDGTNVYDNASPTPGGMVSRVNAGLINSTIYYYAVFSRDTGNLWNEAVTAGSNADTATPSAAASNGPVGYWRFNEASGTTALDSSGNLCTGAIVGATRVTGSPDGTTALSFSGSGQYVQIATCVAPYFGGPFTLEAWIKPNALSGYHAIAVKRGTTAQAVYGLWTSGDRLFGLVYNFDRSSGAELLGNTSLSVGTWAHVALRRDAAGEVSLWVNGVKQTTTGTVVGDANPPGDLYFGRDTDATAQDLNGTLDEVRIHNRALDLAEFNLLPTPAPTPPALVTNFTASDGANAQSVLAWTNPADFDLAQVVVQRKTGSYPTSHTDGTNVYDNASPTSGASVSTTNTGLSNGTTYYYAVFSRDSGNLWNDAVTAGSNADTATPALPGGPVGYWRFNEGSGSTTADSSGNGNTGTISGASWTSSSPDSSTALAFDGIDDYVQVANSSSLNPTSALTIEVWIKPNATPSGQQKAIVEKAYTSPVAPYYQYFLGTYVSEVILYVCVNGQSKYQVSSGAGLAAGKWSHIAAVFDGQNIRLYVDGVIKGSGNVGTGTIPAYNTPLFIGKHKDYTTERFNGSIDEVRIANRALDPAEFNLLPSGPAPTAPALVTNFTASDGANAQAVLAWTNPADSDLAQVVVLRKTGSYPTSHTDGTNVYDNASPTSGASVSTTNTGLSNGTTYYYAVFSKDSGNLWNEAVTAGSNADSATPALSGGPVGYWRFNEGTGSTTADSSGNGNTGTISGASWTSGSPDSSTTLAFDGIDDYVQVANSSSLNPTSALTIEVWIKPNATPSGQQKAIVEKAYTSPVAPYYQYFLGTYVSEVILYVCVNGQSKYQVSSGAGLAAGKWSHIAAVFDGQNIRLYVDGVIKGSGNVGAGTIPSYNTPLFIGKHKDFTTERFNGAIDEVRITNRALDPAEFNLPLAGALSVQDIETTAIRARLMPNPIVDSGTFVVEGPAVTAIEVRIFDLAGDLVYDSGWRLGDSLAWERQTTEGETVANGVYLYVVRARLSGGREVALPTQKLFVLTP